LTVQDVDIFDEVLERVKALDPVNTRKWFDELSLVRFNGGLLEIACPDEVTGRFLDNNCRAIFTQAAQQVTGHLVSVKFSLNNYEAQQKIASAPAASLKLHPDYTFESFVIGPSNRLAHASCVAVSQSPGMAYNPLFLYGSVGLGKTHLMHAICNEARRRISEVQIHFLSCEEFVNRFISAIEEGRLADFQNEFRTAEMLIIDDVQFLREREQSQEEFFHTFNALYNNRKQIILSADCAPGEIPSLEERLISRFKWGLVARIDQPTYETRIAIVKKKANLRGFAVADDIIEYIAQKVQSNIRELEGALTTIYAVAKASNEPLTLNLAKQALGEQIAASEKQINITAIIDVVTHHFGIRAADLQSKKRSQSIAMPRQICMYLARSLTRHSLEEIGGHLGGRDHTTVMHACSKIAELEESDPQTRAELAELVKQIQKG
jgi:chromosomal replication initiator protein